ncbi:hypothetical protein [Streptomyces chryseus]|uniref:hypothetical protein n=1 Tax=Streptomyces chryseus TaxID=68186 RepID=UPI00110F9836|nr:hypothetical protein [Streptomyces chryseus]GGX02218.1 hypothetical protein GCM10010353_17400 [Streptomyces chryseus]
MANNDKVGASTTSAADHLNEAVTEGCTRDDHDHVGDHRAEVLHETPLFLAEYEGAEPELYLNPDDARAMCDDHAGDEARGRCWDWSRNEHGDYVQFWTHEDDDRPLHATGGTVTEIRVQRPAAEHGEKDTPNAGATSTRAKQSADRLRSYFDGATSGRAGGAR